MMKLANEISAIVEKYQADINAKVAIERSSSNALLFTSTNALSLSTAVHERREASADCSRHSNFFPSNSVNYLSSHTKDRQPRVSR